MQLVVIIIGLKQTWHSDITEQFEDENEISFIDEGTVLPTLLKYWKHIHKIEKSIDSSTIIDDICYSTNSKLLDLLNFPALFAQFYYRKPVYTKPRQRTGRHPSDKSYLK